MSFWKISRNRLAGDEYLPGDTSFLRRFWVLEVEPPSNTGLAAKRHMS